MTKIVIDEEATKRSLNEALQGIALDIQESLKSKLTKEHGKDTGDLQANIHAKVVGDTTIEISMPEHGLYVEFGTPPHMPPVEALTGWVRRKWGAKDKKEELQKAWALAMAIKKRGTRPYPFIRPTFEHEVTPIIRTNLKQAFD